MRKAKKQMEGKPAAAFLMSFQHKTKVTLTKIQIWIYSKLIKVKKLCAVLAPLFPPQNLGFFLLRWPPYLEIYSTNQFYKTQIWCFHKISLIQTMIQLFYNRRSDIRHTWSFDCICHRCQVKLPLRCFLKISFWLIDPCQ